MDIEIESIENNKTDEEFKEHIYKLKSLYNKIYYLEKKVYSLPDDTYYLFPNGLKLSIDEIQDISDYYEDELNKLTKFCRPVSKMKIAKAFLENRNYSIKEISKEQYNKHIRSTEVSNFPISDEEFNRRLRNILSYRVPTNEQPQTTNTRQSSRRSKIMLPA